MKNITVKIDPAAMTKSQWFGLMHAVTEPEISFNESTCELTINGFDSSAFEGKIAPDSRKPNRTQVDNSSPRCRTADRRSRRGYRPY